MPVGWINIWLEAFFVGGGEVLCMMCDFVGSAQMSVTLTLCFKVQKDSFTRITSFRGKKCCSTVFCLRVTRKATLSLQLCFSPGFWPNANCNLSQGRLSSALFKCSKQNKSFAYSELSKQLGNLTGT